MRAIADGRVCHSNLLQLASQAAKPAPRLQTLDVALTVSLHSAVSPTAAVAAAVLLRRVAATCAEAAQVPAPAEEEEESQATEEQAEVEALSDSVRRLVYGATRAPRLRAFQLVELAAAVLTVSPPPPSSALAAYRCAVGALLTAGRLQTDGSCDTEQAEDAAAAVDPHRLLLVGVHALCALLATGVAGVAAAQTDAQLLCTTAMLLPAVRSPFGSSRGWPLHNTH
jgi:hypothetical protein